MWRVHSMVALNMVKGDDVDISFVCVCVCSDLGLYYYINDYLDLDSIVCIVQHILRTFYWINLQINIRSQIVVIFYPKKKSRKWHSGNVTN